MGGTRAADQIGVVVVGGGQAGLAVSYYLRAFGVEHVVLERGRIGESWRSARWDTFTLVTPNWMTRLPGCDLAAGTAGDFLPGAEVIGLLERLAAGLPVRAGTEATSVEAGEHGYRVMTTTGELAARAVVIASGGQRLPVIPPMASHLPPDVHQLDASTYRSPGALPDGAVLVVGAGQSGAQIADELVAAGRDVLLASSRVPMTPRRYRGRDVHEWVVELGLYDQATASVSDPAVFREPHPMLAGARGTISYGRLARDGVRLLGRLVGAGQDQLLLGSDLEENVRYADMAAAQFKLAVDDYVARTGIVAMPPGTDPRERPVPLARQAPDRLNIRADRIGTVLWCTGFGADTGWLKVPVLAANGNPVHTRGITAFPGLYVTGFPWLSTRASGLLYGVAGDAVRIAQHIAGDGPGQPPPARPAVTTSAVPRYRGLPL